MMDTATQMALQRSAGLPPAPPPSRRWLGGVAALVIVEALLIFVPLVVLGRAVNWPAGLDAPAATTLPLVAQNEGAVRFGYVAYLTYSLLFFPVIAYIVAAFTGPAGRARPIVRIALGLAAVSALARAIGILRWLTAMPVLAGQWADADPELRQILTVQFHALNDYGGGIGEILGVTALGAGAVACAAVAIRELAPRWLSVFGIVVALVALSPLVELAGGDPGPLTTVAVAGVQFWFIATAVVLAGRARRRTV
jgi:type IV secretory pathway TrbD component